MTAFVIIAVLVQIFQLVALFDIAQQLKNLNALLAASTIAKSKD